MEKSHLEIILETMDRKFDLVLEGHTALANQIAAVDERLTKRADLSDYNINLLNTMIHEVSLDVKAVAADLKATDAKLTKHIDAVAADLKMHRQDTEAHPSGSLYVVKEG